MKVASIHHKHYFYGTEQVEIKDATNLDESFDLMVLWGGEDISPSIYGQPVITKQSNAPSVPSGRDNLEMDCILQAQVYGIPILGICRGAQLLCAYGGGELIQHVEGHASQPYHEIETVDGQTALSNSAHHQQMLPASHHVVVGWCTNKVSTGRVYGGTGQYKYDYPDVEIVYFPEFHALGIQGHPEWLHKEHAFVKLTNNLIDKYLGVQV